MFIFKSQLFYFLTYKFTKNIDYKINIFVCTLSKIH